jgi:SNF2 family DNA or RNA helicase
MNISFNQFSPPDLPLLPSLSPLLPMGQTANNEINSEGFNFEIDWKHFEENIDKFDFSDKFNLFDDISPTTFTQFSSDFPPSSDFHPVSDVQSPNSNFLPAENKGTKRDYKTSTELQSVYGIPVQQPQQPFQEIAAVPRAKVRMLSHNVEDAVADTSRRVVNSRIFDDIKDKIFELIKTLDFVQLDKNYSRIVEAFEKEQKFPPKPQGMVRDLMPYQWRGMEWMKMYSERGLGACLADEMGLGKTTQCIAVIQSLINEKKERSRILVSCPASLIDNWLREIRLAAPNLIKNTVVLSEEKRFAALNNSETPCIYIISHSKLRLNRQKEENEEHAISSSDLELPYSQQWDIAFIDEIHTLVSREKSPSMKALIALRGVTKSLIGLTGTPMPNNLLELHNLVSVLNPSADLKSQDFNKHIIKSAKKSLSELMEHIKRNKGKITQNYSLTSFCKQLQEIINITTKPFMLRRTKDDNEFKRQTALSHNFSKGASNVKPPPGKNLDVVVEYQPTAQQRNLILDVCAAAKLNLEDYDAPGSSAGLSLFRANDKAAELKLKLPDVMTIMQVVDHPSILSEKTIVNVGNPEFAKKVKSCDPLILEKGEKLYELVQLINKIQQLNPQDKIIIFARFKKIGNLICHHLNKNGCNRSFLPIIYLEGKVQAGQRTKMLEEFQSEMGPKILVISRKVGNLGLNITSANHVVIFDPAWNPDDDDQCIGRAYRIGQNKTIQVYRLHQDDSLVDAKMQKFRIEKKAWFNLILQPSEGNLEPRVREIVEDAGKQRI